MIQRDEQRHARRLVDLVALEAWIGGRVLRVVAQDLDGQCAGSVVVTCCVCIMHDETPAIFACKQAPTSWNEVPRGVRFLRGSVRAANACKASAGSGLRSDRHPRVAPGSR